MAAPNHLEAVGGAKKNGDLEQVKVLEHQAAAFMERMAALHGDPVVRQSWKKNAAAFFRGHPDATIAEDVGRGLAILLVAPLAVGAGAFIAAGAMLYGAGQLISGLGVIFTGGLIRSKRNRH
jgi:hypothetical protein